MSLVLEFASRSAILFLLWLLLVDSTDEPDMIAGAVCALVAAALATQVRSLRGISVRPRIEMLRFGYRPLALLVADSARVTRALFTHAVLRRPSSGRFRAARYRAVGDRPEDAARRILTEWGASLGPNCYVIGIDADRHLLLAHELTPSSRPLDPLELG